jgi:inhibitor of KinA sporulation pathway (predicted exonuclease)
MVSTKRAADLMKVGERTVDRAKRVSDVSESVGVRFLQQWATNVQRLTHGEKAKTGVLQ